MVTTQRAPHNDRISAEGFDTCRAPSTGTMRLWTDSRYRAVNAYIGGVGLAPKCQDNPELTKLWVRTVTSNGWSVIPTYVGRQPPCSFNPDKPHFTAANARDRGKESAIDAVTRMKSLGMPKHNPVYVDIEPFDITKDKCTHAAVAYLGAFVRAMHHRDYRAGLYAHHTQGLVPLRKQARPKPDDIWWANWNGVDSTSGDPAVGSSYAGHRIHQYRGDHFETHHRQRLEIDSDAVKADVVGRVRPRVPAGSPYVYQASPPADVDTGLRARAAPRKDATTVGYFPVGAPLAIECQTTGDSVFGDSVWDRLTDGSYVSDLYTTTTGRMSFTEGIPRCTAAAPAVTAPVALSAQRSETAPTTATYTGEGFDKCDTASTVDLRSWLASPYRAVNIYFGGINRACKTQAELTPQWVTTVTSNGWGIIPTFLGLQAPCQSHKTEKFTSFNATAKGTQAADNAADAATALGITPPNPLYYDMEPYNVDNSGCKSAVVDFVSAWTAELHIRGYVSGVYAHPTLGLKPILNRADPLPDDIWFPRYDGNASVEEPTVPETDFVHHRIHQYRGTHTEKFSGVAFSIDNDTVDADIVGAVVPPAPTGPPYTYAASPSTGHVLRARSTPTNDADNLTGTTYAYGEPISIECQAAGQLRHGSYVWDRLTDGSYVWDLGTTTTGGIGFTAGVDRCDTTRPTLTVRTPKPAHLARHHTFRWVGDDPDSGIASYDVRSRRAMWSGSFGEWTETLGLVDPFTRMELRKGETLCIQVRATDRSGNATDWSGQRCISRALDDRAMTATEGWALNNGDDFFRDTISVTRAADEELTLPAARGRRFGVVGTQCRRCGQVAVYIGSTVAADRVGVVDFRADVKRRRVILLLPPLNVVHRGDVHLVAVDDGKPIRVDGVIVSRR